MPKTNPLPRPQILKGAMVRKEETEKNKASVMTLIDIRFIRKLRAYRT